MIDWLLPYVGTGEITNLQYALSTMAQSYAAILGLLLTVGLAFTQLGEYRIPARLLLALSLGEVVSLGLAAGGVVLPVVALSFGLLHLYRVSLLLFLFGIVMLPAFAGRMIRRTRPAFYVPRLLKSKRGWSKYADSVAALAIQAGDKGDWTSLEMMATLLGQLRSPDPSHGLERGWGYQQNLPIVMRYLVDTKNDRGVRSVLRTIAHGASFVPVTSVLSLDESRGWFANKIQSAWLRRPAWVHRIQARNRVNTPLFQRPRSYDYGILMHLTGFIQDLTHVDETRPGEPYLPKRVAGFHEWSRLLTAIVYSCYLLDEASADDPTLGGAKSELNFVRPWESLFSTVEPRMLRNAVRATPLFPGGFGVMYPLHYPKDLQEASRAKDDLRTPAKARAANRLARKAAEIAYAVDANKAAPVFWPQWVVIDGKAMMTGHRAVNGTLPGPGAGF